MMMKRLMMVWAAELCLFCSAIGHCVAGDVGTVTANGYTWSYWDNGNGAEIYEVSPCPTGNVTVPRVLDGVIVVGIGEELFSKCSGLTSVVLPDTLQTIGRSAFKKCTGLRSLSLPESLLEIDGDAFKMCSSLKSLSLPARLESIGEGTFRESGVASITISPDNDIFEVTGNVLWNKSSGEVLTGLAGTKTVEVPEGAIRICDLAFMCNTSLTRVILPSTLEQIGDEAFAVCTALTAITIPDKVKHIGEQAFAGTALTTLMLPECLEEFGGCMFYGCKKIESVYFKGHAPTVLQYSDPDIYGRHEYDNPHDDGWWDDVDIKNGYVQVYSHCRRKVTTYCQRGKNGWPVDDGEWEGKSLVVMESFGATLDGVMGPFTPGEKVSIAIPALVGYTAKGLPSGLKLNKKTGEISGAAKKPTPEDGVTVTFTKKGAEALTTKFIVGPIPTINVTLEGDTEKCKVTGANKAYLVGKKVSLAAKAPKGTAFTGWYKDDQPWPNADEYLNTKIKYVMTTESINLIARFEKEKMAIDASALEAASFAVGTAVAEGAIVINVETQSGLKSLKTTKQPKGLKLKKNKSTGVWSISGTPKMAGSYEVTLKATAKSGAVETVTLTIVIDIQ